MTEAFVLGEVTAYWIGKMAETGGAHARPVLWVGLIAAVCVLLRIWPRASRLTALGLTAFFLAGAARMSWEMRPLPLEKMLLESGELELEAEGTLREEKTKNGYTTLRLEKVRFHGESARESASLPGLTVTVKESLWAPQEAEPGMKVRVRGKAELFGEPRNPGEFNYRLYYRAKGLRVRMWADAAAVSGGKGIPFLRLIGRVREATEEILDALCVPEDAGVYRAVLLGDQTQLSEEVRTLYQENGIAHLLAVSGLHVSLIGMGLYGVLRRLGLGFRGAGLLAGAVLIFYGGLTGFGPSVFRAVAMIFCSLLASYLGRTYDLLSALALALFFLVFGSPYLLFSGGVQLSFAAVAAIGCCAELKAGRKAAKAREADGGQKGKLAETLRVSLFIQLFTYPILLYHFFEFPVYGIVLNLIVLPLMAYVVGSGLGAVFLGFAAQWLYRFSGPGTADLLAGLFGLTASGVMGTGHYLLAGYRLLCEAASRLPWHSLTPGRPSLLRIFLYYLILTVVLWLDVRRGRESEYRGGGVGSGQADRRGRQTDRQNGQTGRSARLMTAALVFAVMLLAVRPVRGLEIDVLDVGQGDGIFLRTGGVRILVDGGSSQVKKLGEERLTPFLKSQGISRLDYAFVTHGDLDHVSGLRYLLEEGEIPVSHLVFSCLSREDETCGELAGLQRRQGGEVHYMEAGQSLLAGKLRLDCLYPEPSDRAGDKNDQSLVLLAAYGDFKMLLTGDLEREGEARLLEKADGRLPRDVTVLKAGHHGSDTSTSEELLERIRPQTAILSYGEGNSYGHPSKEALRRLEQFQVGIFETAESGMVSVKTDGRKITVSGFAVTAHGPAKKTWFCEP